MSRPWLIGEVRPERAHGRDQREDERRDESTAGKKGHARLDARRGAPIGPRIDEAGKVSRQWIPGAVRTCPRSLTRVNAIAMVAGTIIGASIFVQPSEIARTSSTPVEIMLVWVACGVLTLFGALVCAELASAFPQTGGLYVFLRDTFSPLAGFLWGWAMFWTMHSGIIAAIAMVFARYAALSCRSATPASARLP